MAKKAENSLVIPIIIVLSILSSVLLILVNKMVMKDYGFIFVSNYSILFYIWETVTMCALILFYITGLDINLRTFYYNVCGVMCICINRWIHP